MTAKNLRNLLGSLLWLALAPAMAIAGQAPLQMGSNQVFTSQEQVEVSFGWRWRWGYENRNSDLSVDLWLHKVKDIGSLTAKTKGALPIPEKPLSQDLLQSEARLIKHWQEKPDDRRKLNLGKLEPGYYILQAFAAGQSLQLPVVVSDYSLIVQKVKNQNLIYTAHTLSGKRATGLKARAYLKNPDYAIDLQLADAGLFSYTTTKKENGANSCIYYAFKGDQIAVSSSYMQHLDVKDQKPVAYLYTDRPGYRPDQTIKFKGVLRLKQGQKLIPATDSITYMLVFNDREDIMKKKVALSENGTFSDSIPIDKNWKLGDYSIKLSHNRQIAKYWWYWKELPGCSFVIEEYKKPEYEVLVNFEKEQYVLGEQAKATVQANYFFGSPVKEAKVEYSLIRERMHVPYWQRYAYSWWYSRYYSHRTEREVISRGEGKLNEEGKFELDFEAIKPEGETAKNYKYLLIANVTDASRRTIEGSASATASWMPYLLSVNSEERYYEVGEEATITASITDLQQRPIKQRVRFEVTQRSWDYINGYSDRTLKEEALLTDPETGLAQLKFTPQKAGSYSIKAVLQEGDKRMEENASFYAMKEAGGWWGAWDKNEGSISILTNKKVYKRGEKVKATVMIQHEADILFLANNHEIITHSISSLNKPQPPMKEAAEGGGASKMYELDFFLHQPYGPVELRVAYVKDGKYHFKKEEIMIIPDDQYLDVSITFDKGQYKPGTLAEATVQVLDASGKPVPHAEVSLSTADESIYFLYGDQSGDIRKALYEPQQISEWTSESHNAYRHNSYSSQATFLELIERYRNFSGEVSKTFFFNYERQHWWLQRSRFLNPKPKPMVKGFVLDAETGKPLKNVAVTVGGKTFRTNRYGVYAIQGFGPGLAEISFQHGDKKLSVENLRFDDRSSIILNIALDDEEESIELKNYSDKKAESNTDNLSDAQSKLFGDKAEELEIYLPETVEVPDENEIAEEIEVEFDEETVVESTGDGGFGSSDDMAIADVASAAPRISAKSSERGRPVPATEQAAPRPQFKEAVIRKDFKDAIYWNPSIKTDAQGKATVRIQLPDNLTTWRTLAKVITQDAKVGQAMAKTIVRKNLLVRMETPRFITTDDQMLIATNIHNYLSEAKKVKVKLSASGVKVEGTEQVIRVPANGEKRVDWPITAPWLLKAKITVEALTDEESDAMKIEVPVQPNGLEILLSKAAFNQGKSTASMELNIPQSADLNTASAEVSVVPGVTAALLSSMDDLIGYPYGCVEQTMSRFLPNVLVANTLREVGSQYESNVDSEELKKMVAKGTKRLGELQHSDGGWGWWKDDETHPYYTAYVMFGLQTGKQAGYEIPENMYRKGLKALESQVSKGNSDKTLQAYQMMVAMHCGLLDQWNPDRLDLQDLDNAYQAALWMQAALLKGETAFAGNVKQWIVENVQEGINGTNYWGGKRYYYRWQDDRVETTAHVVRALAMQDPDNALLAPAAQWLMMQRKGSSWHNTRQTAMTIFGLNELIKQELNTDAEVRVYANGTLLNTIKFGGEERGDGSLLLRGETITASLQPLMEKDGHSILKHGENTIRIVFEGEGRAYTNAKLKYFLGKDNQKLGALKKEAAFSVKREYYKLIPKMQGGKAIYEKLPLAEAKIKSGDVVLVKAVIGSEEARENVLIEDPIPAGCEFVQNKTPYIILGEKGYSGVDNESWTGYWKRWYTHQEYRDNRYVLTVTNLGKERYEYSYLMRAQIPGQFQVNPAVAQLMYYPEIRGFSDFMEMEIGD